MGEQLASMINGVLNGAIPNPVIVCLVSMIPIVELRGAIFLGQDLVPTFIAAIIGNMLPIPFILLFIDKIFKWLKKTRFANAVTKLENKALSKSDKIEKYGFWGLMIFVGIPLPGTGAWTGALAASLLRMKKTKAILAIFLGVLLAGVIIALLKFGLLNAIIGWFK